MPTRQPRRPHRRRGVDGRKGAGPARGIPRASKAGPHRTAGLLVYRSIPRSGPLTVWVPTPPPNCWSPLAPIRTGCATRRRSPRCAVSAPVPASSGKITRHRLSRGGDRAANNALYRIALVRMSARSTDPRLRPAPTATAAPRRRFCGCSNAPSSAKYSDCSPGPPRSTTTATCGLPDKPKTSPWPPSPPFRRPGDHRLAARTRPPTQRHPGQQLPPVAQHPDHRRRLTPNRDRSIKYPRSRLTWG